MMATEIDQYGVGRTIMAADTCHATFPEHVGNVWINAECDYARIQLSLTRDQAIILANSIIAELGTETSSPTVVVTINGKSVETEKQSTYEELVALAGMTGQPSMVYDTPRQRIGTVTPGKSLRMQDGMRFTICHTGNA